MSSKDELIKRLNTAMAWELAGIIQYMQHAVMLTGHERETFHSFFHEGSEEARDHAEVIGEKIAVLGGVPTVEPALIRQAADIDGMLEAALALEEDALAAWEAAHEVAGAANPGTLFWIEEHIAEEQEHVDNLRKLTSKVKFGAKDLKKSQKKTS
ncbi:MAG: ferritin-like domain-containing protein [Bradymonadaceae bacterium]|nr:ferritin-like domain-containing protein [Lujinxingiaceae bacterium]